MGENSTRITITNMNGFVVAQKPCHYFVFHACCLEVMMRGQKMVSKIYPKFLLDVNRMKSQLDTLTI